MFIPIQIDLDDLIQEFDLDLQQVQILAANLTNQMVDTFYASLKQKVNSSLKGTTRDLYLKNLTIENIDLLTKEIVLSGFLPNALESGTPSFDMKEGFQNSKLVKFGKDGSWYFTVKFPFKSKDIPQEIKKIVQQQTIPLKIHQIPESYAAKQIKNIIGANGKKIGEYQHKHPILEGLQKREIILPNKKIQTEYNTFRRVGAKSDLNAFIHPGFQKRDFFGKALNDISANIPILADEIIDDFLKEQGF